MAQSYSFAALEAEYIRRWRAMAFAPARGSAIDAMARKVVAGTTRYRMVEAVTGVPWAFIGVLHAREAGCDFRGVLHNGEKILGTGRMTRQAPAGRGPFQTWEEAAIDALRLKGFAPGFAWSLPRCLYEGERFNGFGYRMHGVPSAYLWSGTDQYARGKYVADGVWNAAVADKQVGIAPIMKRLLELEPEAGFGLAVEPAAAAPVAGAPGAGLDPGEIRALQQRLRDLGYAEAGRADGLWGPRTTAGVAAFQATAGLPVSGGLDTATAAALATAAPRPVSPMRAAITAGNLAVAGDAVACATGWSKWGALLLGLPAVLLGVLDQVPLAVGKVAVLRDAVGALPSWLGPLAVAVVAVALYALAHRTEVAQVDAVRTGRDAGPG
ncbi:peptidoglycan-binding protein [Xanthobacter agilis]|uniref:Lysozyme family protein n=1 Tax=Xanthobacter agilis TaxID=47492 RepID=A0ABU0LHD6_XANAG|nr:peptidoglycan-binding protein [Xanthobacter agilis]MDQ0506534.1 lysozyme family protein [Xanthobacter agilis]